MNPDDPEKPSLLKPDTGDQPAAAFSSGMPDPFARQASDDSAQPNDLFQVDRPNSTAAKTLGGYNKSTENIVPTSDYRNGQTDSPTASTNDDIYRIDSPADGNGRLDAANPAANQTFTAPPDDLQSSTTIPPVAAQTNQAFPAQSQSPASAQTPQNNQAFVTPNPSSASDYLNQIAPVKSRGQRFFSRKILIIGGTLALALIATIIAVSVVNNSRQSSQQFAVTVGSRLTDLQTLVTYGRSNNVGSSDVVKVTAETNLVALSQQNGLGKLFTLTGSEKDSAPTPDFVADLDSAKANSNLESVYVETLIQQLNSTYIAMQNLNQQNMTTAARDTLTLAMSDIEELYRRLTE